MAELGRKGPSAVPRKRKRPAAASPMAALADAETWRLFRKLLAHPDLRAAALELASRYTDPADDPGG
jgi:hypothetical protein